MKRYVLFVILVIPLLACGISTQLPAPTATVLPTQVPTAESRHMMAILPLPTATPWVMFIADSWNCRTGDGMSSPVVQIGGVDVWLENEWVDVKDRRDGWTLVEFERDGKTITCWTKGGTE